MQKTLCSALTKWMTKNNYTAFNGAALSESGIFLTRLCNYFCLSAYQIIWLLAQGKPTQEVASVTGYSRSWIYELVWGYNRIGPQTLGDHRHQNPGGSEPLLDDVQQADLWQALQSPPADGGQWNGRKVADWIGQLIGRSVARQRGWEYLKQMRYRLRVPRPKHEEAEPQVQAEWKKKSGAASAADPDRESRLRRRSLGRR